ncbi:tubulin epsilon and delta complex protein 1-like isoform X2 [Belonocnema kinseyi]|uniref:tubulin epsilon and delta complex protein 1-like isoform X2 n=1 Tax=Belonocnema kinseyi TaxID=2817044 RepID=UPI00143CE9CF|nr:tubulin epsilon and delta complex protein 1-like isoform X2 [Belonocnema kinseyi]
MKVIFTTLTMSDTKSVIELLCKHLSCTTEVPMKPDFFRLAKYNKSSPEAIEAFWSVLHILSTCVVTEKDKSISFKDYDKITSTKLNFAFLQYSALEFYSIPETDTFNSRELLLALGWLFSSNNAIDTTFRSKIINSSLGKESSSQVSAQKPLEKIQLFSAEDQMKNIVHTCTKLNHNLKQISELISEKIKLATKVHAASINASGLPHLSVFEMALTKRLSSQKKNSEDQETIWSLQNLSTMIDLHPKWIKKQHIFFEWMISVIEESKSAQKPIITEESCLEIFKFTTCLRHFVKKKMHNLKRNLDEIPNFDSAPDCVSRLLRIQNSETEAENWVEKAKKNLELTEKEIELKEKDLLKELKSMLKLIQNCVRV